MQVVGMPYRRPRLSATISWVYFETAYWLCGFTVVSSVGRESRTRTVSPRSRRSRAVWLPMNPAPPVIRTRSAMLGRTPPRDHHGDRAQHDRDVQPDRPSLDVVEIDRQHLREGNPAARRDLVETGDPRLHRQPQAAAVVVERVLLGDRWARADDAHVAPEHVEQLGDLVEAEPPQDASDRRHPRIADHLEPSVPVRGVAGDELAQPLAVVAVVGDDHAPELVVGEVPPVLADDGAAEERRAGTGHPDEHRDRQPERASEDENGGRDDDVEEPAGDGMQPGPHVEARSACSSSRSLSPVRYS